MPITIKKRERLAPVANNLPPNGAVMPSGDVDWYKEAVICGECGWTGVARLRSPYWTLDKFRCPDCSGSLRLEKDGGD